MTALPPSAVRATLDAEWPGVVAWAGRHGWAVVSNFDQFALRAATYHPATRRLVEFVAHAGDYRSLPPAWRAVVPGTDQDADRSHFPKPGPGSSIFHGNLVLCAPWNRLAYRSVNESGPHTDWGGPESWLTHRGDYTEAHTLADMLSCIDRFLRVSPGMME